MRYEWKEIRRLRRKQMLAAHKRQLTLSFPTAATRSFRRHCISASAVGTALKSQFGNDIPEVSMSSVTASGIPGAVARVNVANRPTLRAFEQAHDIAVNAGDMEAASQILAEAK
jgi:hypothetical protein